jgi:hypothetical protein
MYPLTQNAGHSVTIDLSQSTKDRINSSIAAVLDNNLSGTAIFPASISNNTLTIYSIDIGSNYLKSTLMQPLTQNAGHSITLDLSDSTKSTINNAIQRNQITLAATTSTSAIYPVTYTNSQTTTLLELLALDVGSNYLTIDKIDNPTSKTVRIDLSQTAKDKIASSSSVASYSNSLLSYDAPNDWNILNRRLVIQSMYSNNGNA